MKLILVRYGEHENGHLNESGKKTMLSVAKKLEDLVKDKKCCVVCAKIFRAIESAEIIGKSLGFEHVKSFKEFYAAGEDNVPVNLDRARKVLNDLKKDYDVVIAIISREYIEELGRKTIERGDFLEKIWN